MLEMHPLLPHCLITVQSPELTRYDLKARKVGEHRRQGQEVNLKWPESFSLLLETRRLRKGSLAFDSFELSVLSALVLNGLRNIKHCT